MLALMLIIYKTHLCPSLLYLQSTHSLTSTLHMHDFGVDKGAKDNYGMTAVQLADSKGQNATVSLFMSEFGVDQEAKDNNEMRAPELAAYNRQNATVGQIDEHDADVVFLGMFKKTGRRAVSYSQDSKDRPHVGLGINTVLKDVTNGMTTGMLVVPSRGSGIGLTLRDRRQEMIS